VPCTTRLLKCTGHEITDMTDLVTRPRADIADDVNEALDRLLGDAAGRIAALEMALVWLSQTNGSRSNVADANTLAIRVQTAARRAPKPQPTDDKINEAFKRATEV
jgi:hypothetical protein